MRFEPTPLAGAYVIHPKPMVDERGQFSRVFCADEFSKRGLNPSVAQTNISYSRKRGTLRGLHFQVAPHREVKLVLCLRGAIYDVIVDLRKGSPTWRQWFGIELCDVKRSVLYVPEGFAHGFVTLSDDTELLYKMSTPYVPEAAQGVRFDDPALGITWPILPEVISERDAALSWVESFPDGI